MATIHVTTHSHLSPERVLAAGYDFSAWRAENFPAVSTPYLEVHELSQTSADVTEGTPASVGINWERCRYDWSQTGSVKALVTDSNVYQPANSSWELRATPSERGSQVEMIWIREFTHNACGRIFGTLFRLIGKVIFTREAKRTIRNLERVETVIEREHRDDALVTPMPQLPGQRLPARLVVPCAVDEAEQHH